MPDLSVMGLSAAQAETLARTTIPTLAALCNCPADWFSVAHQDTTFYGAEGILPTRSIVRVDWFERPQDLQDQVAAALHAALVDLGMAETEITFHIYSKAGYYENGLHC